MSAIMTEQLSKRYGNTLALDRLDLVVEPGEVYGYLGPNGAGKTTTIRLLLGLHRPSGGRAELLGLDAWGEPVAAHRRVAHVAGEPYLWPSLTAEETLAYLARLHGSTDDEYQHVALVPSQPFRTGAALVLLAIAAAAALAALQLFNRRDLVSA